MQADPFEETHFVVICEHMTPGESYRQLYHFPSASTAQYEDCHTSLARYCLSWQMYSLSCEGVALYSALYYSAQCTSFIKAGIVTLVKITLHDFLR